MRSLIYLTVVAFIIFSVGTECHSDARASLENGLKAYREADFDKTISELRKAIDLGLDIPADMVQAHLHLAFAHIGRGERAAAEIEFAKAIQLDPALELDPDIHSTKVINVFNDMRESLVDSLVVVSVPGGAEVYLDESKTSSGITPLKLDNTLIGEHNVRIVKEYFKPQIVKIKVEKGKDNRAQANLDKAEVELRVTSQPPKANAYIADKGRFQSQSHGTTPILLKATLGQELAIKLAKEEFLNKEFTIKLTEEGITTSDTEEIFLLKNGVGNIQVNLDIAPLPGSLRITSEPSSATIWLDGVKVGEAPLNLERITPGNRRLRASISGFASITKSVEIISNQETTVKIELGGRLRILSVPGSAQVFIDGKYAGLTPFNTRRIPAGPHQLRFSAEKYQDKLVTARVEKGQEKEVNIRLLPIRGSVSISSDPPGAAVYLEDENKGNTPLLIYGITIGQYSLRLTKSGYRNWEKQITVEELKVLWQFAKLKAD